MRELLTDDLTDIKAYEEALKKHDWYYMMSEDPKIHEFGSFNHNKLIRLTVLSNEHKELFKKYADLNRIKI